MICVLKIELLEVKGQDWVVHHPDLPEVPLVALCDMGKLPEDLPQVTREVIQGEKFRLPDGREFCIGLSEEVHVALGIPLKAWANMNEMMDEQRAELFGLRKCSHNQLHALKQYRTMSRWERFRFLFKRKEK